MSSGRAAERTALDRRLVWSVLALATVAAVALRLPLLLHQSFWFDEIFTRDIAGEPSLSGVWHHVRVTEATPPLYYVIVWALGGRTAPALRAVPAAALVAAVPVAFFALRRLAGERAALASAAIVAVSPLLVSFAADARAYGVVVLMALLSVWAFAAMLERGRARDCALWVAACAACVWTHYFGVFVVGAEVIVLLAMRPERRRATLVGAALIVLCLLPLLPLVLAQSGDERARFIAGMPLAARVASTVRQFAMGMNVPRTWLEAAGLLVACAGLVLGVVLAARSRGGSRALLWLAALAFGVPLLLAVTGIEDRFYARNLVPVLPLAAGLAAPALLRLRMAPLALYLVVAAIASAWVATDWRYQQPDWRLALQRAAAIDRRAAVVAVTRFGGFVVRTYWGRAQTFSTVRARAAWVVVEPHRRAGQRALGPAPVPVSVLDRLVGFVEARQWIVHGFRVILMRAPGPMPIIPGSLGARANVFPAAVG